MRFASWLANASITLWRSAPRLAAQRVGGAVAGGMSLAGVAAGLTGVACSAAHGWSVNTALPFVPMQRWISVCARTGTALEVNAHPDRLDLRDEDILRARRYGVRFAVNSDAHAVPHLANMRYGIGTAQRGWLTADDVINAWPERRLRSFLRKGR